MGGLLAKDTMTKASWIISKVIHKAQSSKVPLLHPQPATPPLFHTQQQPLHCPQSSTDQGHPADEVPQSAAVAKILHLLPAIRTCAITNVPDGRGHEVHRGQSPQWPYPRTPTIADTEIYSMSCQRLQPKRLPRIRGVGVALLRSASPCFRRLLEQGCLRLCLSQCSAQGHTLLRQQDQPSRPLRTRWS